MSKENDRKVRNAYLASPPPLATHMYKGYGNLSVDTQ